jgi:uncharacterized membrane protein HdeD (DUF308 family)
VKNAGQRPVDLLLAGIITVVLPGSVVCALSLLIGIGVLFSGYSPLLPPWLRFRNKVVFS